MSGILKKLTESIVQRDLQKEGAALVAKWTKTGLLEGLKSERDKNCMSLLLENQTKELLREASSMSGGDVEGFAAVAFPLVRRIFAGLIGNELVSVQPMSLPSGLIFFLDFTYTDTKQGSGAVANASIYGGGRVGAQITGGVDITGRSAGTNGVWNVETGFRSLSNGYTSPTGSITLTSALTLCGLRSGSTGVWNSFLQAKSGDGSVVAPPRYKALGDSLVNFDPDLSGSHVGVFTVNKGLFTNLNINNLVTIHTCPTGTTSNFSLVRRLTRQDPVSASNYLLTFASYNSGSYDVDGKLGWVADLTGALPEFSYALTDPFTAGSSLGSVVGTTPWGLEGTSGLLSNTGTNTDIPEIDIKVDSTAVTAITKKLKAKWTPELGQDLNAYHNLDAEVELTSILSEQIALEIDQEILNDLVKGGTAGTYYWSRRPGKFLNRLTGEDITNNGNNVADFTGTVSAWYETLLETVNDVSAQIHRKTLRGGANFMVTSPEVANILEFTAGFRASVMLDDEKGEAGVVNVGSISKKWDVFVDPYFPRNAILVGRKGKSFLESGYAYCPYIPLQVTPTIFGTDDFVPRKGVMTRYAKKMVRPDFYGLVIILDLLG
jgi:hypothetical protein